MIGSVADADAVRAAMTGCEVVFHQAAHKAVLRSVEHPLPTDTANTHGTLVGAGGRARRSACDASCTLRRAASTAAPTPVPTPEDAPLRPRSPYAVSKLAGEEYCRVFAELYGLETVALRYFNVYGPRQRPDATYAAVIPLFIDALLNGRAPGRARRRPAVAATSPTSPTSSTRTSPPRRRPGRRVQRPRLQRGRGQRVVAARHPARARRAARRRARRRSSPTRAPATCATAAPTRPQPRATSASAAAVELDEGLRRTVDWLRTLA